MICAETLKILCVDDEPNILSTLRRFFRKDNYQILTAGSATEALMQLEDHAQVALIISDFRMPGANGIEFLKNVKIQYPQTVGILLTGYADLIMVEEALDLRVIYRHVKKPWKREELRVAVNDALGHYLENRCS